MCGDTPAVEETIRIEKDSIVFRGRCFEIVERAVQATRGGRCESFVMEIARRSPGVRVLVRHENSLLIIREFRSEHSSWDYRLPGGKVFDSRPEWAEGVVGADLGGAVVRAAEKEVLEEAGVRAGNLSVLTISKAGATIEWDLYYLTGECDRREFGNQELGIGEFIHPIWLELSEVRSRCLNGDFKEDRTVGVLLRYLWNETGFSR